MVSGRPNLMLSPGPGLWSLVLGPYRPDLGPDLDLTWDLDLDLSLTTCFFFYEYTLGKVSNKKTKKSREFSLTGGGGGHPNSLPILLLIL